MNPDQIRQFNNQRMPNASAFLESDLFQAARDQFSARPISITDLQTGWQWSAGTNGQRAYPVPLVVRQQVSGS